MKPTKMKKGMNHEERVAALVKSLSEKEPMETLSDEENENPGEQSLENRSGIEKHDKIKPRFGNDQINTSNNTDLSEEEIQALSKKNQADAEAQDKEGKYNEPYALHTHGKESKGMLDHCRADPNCMDIIDDDEEGSKPSLFKNPNRHEVHVKISLGRRK